MGRFLSSHNYFWLILAVVPEFLNMASSSPSTGEKVDPKFLAALRESKGRADIVVLFAAGTKQVLDELNAARTFATREERLVAVNTALTENAAKSQASVSEFLKSKGAASGYIWDSKWINNSIFVKNADAPLIDELVNFAEVSKIREDKIVAKILLESDQQ